MALKKSGALVGGNKVLKGGGKKGSGDKLGIAAKNTKVSGGNKKLGTGEVMKIGFTKGKK